MTQLKITDIEYKSSNYDYNFEETNTFLIRKPNFGLDNDTIPNWLHRHVVTIITGDTYSLVTFNCNEVSKDIYVCWDGLKFKFDYKEMKFELINCR